MEKTQPAHISGYQLTLGSLFDGIGGFPYAASFYGIRPLWASEIVPECISVTKRHFPEMAHLGDITQLHGGELPPVDIITFGSPCQDLSTAKGHREGLAGARSGLFMEAIRIIREMQEATNGKYPQFAIWENVPGCMSSNSRLDFAAVLEAFTEAEIPMPRSGRWANAGMVRGGSVDLAWVMYDAQHFGTAQRRRRLFLVADFRGQRAGQILFVPKSLRGYFEAGGTPRQGIAAFAGAGTGTAGKDTGRNLKLDIAERSPGSRPIEGLNCCEDIPAAMETDGASHPLPQKGSANVEILNDQGGGSITVERGGVSPTLRSKTHGNLPIVACAPVCMATRQANAGIMEDKAPTLMASHENPILVHPQIAGTLCASGAGLDRSAGMASEPDFCIVSAGFKHKASGTAGSIGYQEEASPTLLAGQESSVVKAYVIGAYYSGGMLSDNPASGIYEANTSRTLDLNGGNPSCQQGGLAIVETNPPIRNGKESTPSAIAAVDCRNFRETPECSGTLQAKSNSGGYSLNCQNPVRIGIHVRRLIPVETERLQGFPDGWTECGCDGRKISDAARYRMIGNSIAVPCVAYIMQGIRDVMEEANENDES